MDTPTTTTTTSSSSSSNSLSDSLNTVATVLSSFLSPKDYQRSRSHSNATLASSRSVTPVLSRAPSTAYLPGFLLEVHEPTARPESSHELPSVRILELIPKIADHLGAGDILQLSRATSRFRYLRESERFKRHLMLNGWDTEALVRRTEMTKDSKGRPWLFLARSAIQKDDILTRYALLPKAGEKKSLSKDRKNSVAVKKFLRILMDVVTEHDQHNFSKLTSLANSLQLSLIQFVAAIQAYNWKTRYQKTFIVAAYTNSQTLYPENEKDLEKLSETLDFEDSKPPLLLLASRANLLYTYACMGYSKVSPIPLQSVHYDEPHLTTRGTALPGLRQAIDRFIRRTAASGFYCKASGETSPMRVNFEPKGLDTKSRLPFSDKHILTLEAVVSGGKEDPQWHMSGSIDRNTGIGKLRTTSGLVYDTWVTPWGVAGQKVRGEGKRLGVFVLHWTWA